MSGGGRGEGEGGPEIKRKMKKPWSVKSNFSTKNTGKIDIFYKKNMEGQQIKKKLKSKIAILFFWRC